MITRMSKMIKMNEVTKVTILITLTNLGTRRSGRVCQGTLGAVHILRNMLWGGRGLPDLLQYYIGGVSSIYYNTLVAGAWTERKKCITVDLF